MALKVTFLFPGPVWAKSRGGLKMDDILTGVNGTPLPDMTIRQFHAYFRTHFNVGDTVTLNALRGGQKLDLTAPFLCAQAAARHMLGAGGGVIVNVASALGHTAMPGRAAYASAKHGLIGLTKVLGIEWATRGVRCLAVSPGYVATELVKENMRRGGFDERDIERRTPVGRLATPAEVARVVAFLASDSASYMTASHVLVDGGWVGYGGF